MQSFKEFLGEARRNPELNPKISIYKALEPYKDRDDMHITYTADVGKDFSGVTGRNISGFKVGINPKSTFNTPNGVYVYPLKQAWKLYANKTTQKIHVPYAGDEPTVALLQQTSGANVVDVSEISSKDYDRDYMKLAKMIIKNVKSGVKMSEAFGWEYAKAVLELAQKDARDKSPGGIWWNMTRYTFFAIQRFRPRGSNFFTSDAPTPEYKDEVFAMMRDPKMKANFGDMTNRFTNMQLSRNTTKSSNVWSQIFLDLGVDGVTDRLGKRIIHPSEPMQGVFFNPRAYKVVGSFYNKGYQEDGPSGNGIVLVNKTVDGTPSGIMVGAEISQADLISGVYAISGANRAKYVLFRAAVVRFLTKVYGGATLTIDASIGDFNKVQDAILSGNTSKFPFKITIRTNNNNDDVIILTDNWFSFEVPEKSEYFILDYTELEDQEKRDELNDWIKKQV